MLESLFPAFAAESSASLKQGDSVVAWLRDGSKGQLEKWLCKLVAKVGYEWKVRWANQPESRQKFAPHVDLWEIES